MVIPVKLDTSLLQDFCLFVSPLCFTDYSQELVLNNTSPKMSCYKDVFSRNTVSCRCGKPVWAPWPSGNFSGCPRYNSPVFANVG